MPHDVARAAFYRGRINLWVEDALSLEYLSALWNDPDVAFFIGGGNEGVRAVVEDAKAAKYANVFGVIDRDFRESNQANWRDETRDFRVFILPVHEIENYLLDAQALHQSRFNNRRLPADKLEKLIKQAADRLVYWALCRDVLAELKRRFREPFVPDPPRNLDSFESAKIHICNHPWFKKLAHEVERISETDIVGLLNDGFQDCQARLDDGRWRSDFAGKEIFRDIGSRIFDRRKSRFPVEFDNDLAKDIAAAQVAANSVPPDLTELLAALKRRIARLRAPS